MRLIPTKYKQKPPHTHSYPIGAELVSECLREVPQFDQLILHFYYHAEHVTTSKTVSALFKQKPREIFVASYHNHPISLSSSNKFIEEGWHQEHWELNVYAVACEVKSVVKNLLLTAGLPQVRHWLKQPKSDTWKHGAKYCRLLFHESRGTIEIQAD